MQPLKGVILVSKSGLNWQLAADRTSGYILARPEGLYLLDGQGVLRLSKDDCHTWTVVESLALDPYARPWLTLAGDRPVVVQSVADAEVTVVEIGA